MPPASSDRIEAARARIRAAGLDPDAVPHAGAETFNGFNAWIVELTALGLGGEALVAVLAGPPIPREEEPADLTALLAELCATES
jgi:hypothetical protein